MREGQLLELVNDLHANEDEDQPVEHWSGRKLIRKVEVAKEELTDPVEHDFKRKGAEEIRSS